MGNLQDLDPWVFVAVAVALSVVVGILVFLSQKKKWDYSRAEAMRAKVEQELPELREREASALESEAQAERARADADRLEAQASERRSEVEDQRSELAEQLRAADERDPSVHNDVDEYRHVDDSGGRN
ncbi:MAG TPA: hypothetical protein VMZ66_09640 [Aeromicrobium sp.]|nr:hypothetical protein [Aeromicrobium sp.]